MNQTLMGIWTRITWKSIIVTLVWAALSVPAFAADNVHPAELPLMQSAPIWNRTGIYVGGHIGGLRFQSRDWTRRSIGQVATTIITAQMNAARKGRRIQKEATESPPMNITPSVTRARSVRLVSSPLGFPGMPGMTILLWL